MSYIYANLPSNIIIRLSHPRRGDSAGQETFLPQTEVQKNCMMGHSKCTSLRKQRTSSQK